jgi:hypothetical protein
LKPPRPAAENLKDEDLREDEGDSKMQGIPNLAAGDVSLYQHSFVRNQLFANGPGDSSSRLTHQS